MNLDKESMWHWMYEEWLHWSEAIWDYKEGNVIRWLWNVLPHHFVWSLGFIFGFNVWYCKRIMKCADCYVDITVEKEIERRLPGIDWKKYNYSYESDYIGSEKSDRGYGYHKIRSVKITRRCNDEIVKENCR